jgi:hypothetical protein
VAEHDRGIAIEVFGENEDVGPGQQAPQLGAAIRKGLVTDVGAIVHQEIE